MQDCQRFKYQNLKTFKKGDQLVQRRVCFNNLLAMDCNVDNEEDNDVENESHNVAPEFIREIFNARCHDLGIVASEDARCRFDKVLRHQVTETRFLI
jgi:hypothetical protein